MNTDRPSRLAVMQVYAKRAFRWRRNSYPYISGDAFADFADFVFDPPLFRNFNKVKLQDAKVIFIRSEFLQEFLISFGEKISASVLICGNSDFEFHSPIRNIPTPVKALFLQNSYISDNEKIFTIPIGIENFRLGVNGNPKFLRNSTPERTRQKKVLIGPLSITHPLRVKILNDFDTDSDEWLLIRNRMNPKKFDSISRRFTHIAAVRGNGVDTHRLWESLYRGSIPIVENSIWWESLSHIYPEVEVIDCWLDRNLREILSKFQSPSHRLENPALWMPYWERKISAFLV